MTTLSASQARAQLYRLIDQVAASHQPVHIKGRRHSAVLVSAEDWRAMAETLHLLSVPGMRESVKESMGSRWREVPKSPIGKFIAYFLNTCCQGSR